MDCSKMFPVPVFKLARLETSCQEVSVANAQVHELMILLTQDMVAQCAIQILKNHIDVTAVETISYDVVYSGFSK